MHWKNEYPDPFISELKLETFTVDVLTVNMPKGGSRYFLAATAQDFQNLQNGTQQGHGPTVLKMLEARLWQAKSPARRATPDTAPQQLDLFQHLPEGSPPLP